MNNEKAQQVNERNRFDYVLLVMGTYVNANKITFWCVCVLYLTRKSVKNSFIYNDGPDVAGPIVRRPMGLPITSGCDTARIRTRDISDATSTGRQCLRLLRP
jgi:hypothetical protein